MSQRMPVIFFGHGNPMNALASNDWTEAWADVGRRVPRPRAILCVSAHWYLPHTSVTAMDRPRTIHDFGGFPRELFEYDYPAPGDVGLAERVRELLAPQTVGLDREWGLDHGTWAVLCHVFPDADIPVVQLSLDETRTPEWHYETARRLAPLREEGVLVIGSGNVVHNLHAYAWGRTDVEALGWAQRFESAVKKAVFAGKHEKLVGYEAIGRDAVLSVPTPDHYLPFLYVLALRHEDDEPDFFVDGMDGGSVSMLSLRLASREPAESTQIGL